MARRIRIGNDVTVRWRVVNAGTAEPLIGEGEEWKLLVRSSFATEEAEGAELSGGTITWTLPGAAQRRVGPYRLILIVNPDMEGQKAVDIVAFELVPVTEAADDELLVDILSEVQAGMPGPKGEKGDDGTSFAIKGYYPDLAALIAAVPAPSSGDAYGVGEAAPYVIYIWDSVTSTWVNNGTLQGEPGKSAYEIAVEHGYIGTEAEWLESLHGKDGSDGTDGADGDSAYQIAVEQGYIGTEEEWLASLVGKQGEQGVPGDKGEQGEQGEQGKQGEQGLPGLSAYQVAVEEGFVGTVQEWLASLQGEQGIQGIQGEQGLPGADGKDATINGVNALTVQAQDGVSLTQSGSVATIAADTSVLATKQEVETLKSSVEGKISAHTTDVSNPHQVTKSQVGLANADNTSDNDKPVSAAQKAAIGAVQTSLDSHTEDVSNPHQVTKAQIGLGNVDNTSDASKPVSTAQKAAIDTVQASLDSHAGNISNPHQVTKAQVGLSEVTNDAQVKRSEIGVAGGVAQLDESGLVPSSQLPSYVDDVLEYSSRASFPETGESGKIYIAVDTNLTYRWSGTQYTEIAASLALGETSSTAYPGDKGKLVADSLEAHKADYNNPHQVTKAQVGLGNVDNTSDLDKPVSTAVQSAISSASQGASQALQSHIDDKENPHGVTKSQVGLGNVDNTSDLNKPVSTAVSALVSNTRTALETSIQANADSISAHVADKGNPHEVTKAQVGLGNVDNTSDANKPVSTAQQNAIDSAVSAAKAEIATDLSSYATIVYVDGLVGEIATALDTINGEVI